MHRSQADLRSDGVAQSVVMREGELVVVQEGQAASLVSKVLSSHGNTL